MTEPISGTAMTMFIAAIPVGRKGLWKPGAEQASGQGDGEDAVVEAGVVEYVNLLPIALQLREGARKRMPARTAACLKRLQTGCW